MGIRATMWAKPLRVGSPTKKLLLLVLADRVRDEGEHAWCTWAGQDALASDMEVTERTVRSLLSEFESVGLITREKRRRPDGYRTSDLIRLNGDWEPPVPPEAPPAMDDEPAEEDPATGDDPDVPEDPSPEEESPENGSPENSSASCEQDLDDDADLTGKDFPGSSRGPHRKSTTASPETTSAQEPGSRSRSRPRSENNVDAGKASTDLTRPDVQALCQLLAERIGAHGDHPPPKVTDGWLKDMRLLVDRGPTGQGTPENLGAEKVETGIRFLFEHLADPGSNGFCWANQVQSPKALRKHWLKIRQAAKAQREGANGTRRNGKTSTAAAWDGSREVMETTDPDENYLDTIFGRATA